MEKPLSLLISGLVDNMEEIQSIWFSIFAENLCKTWANNDSALKIILKKTQDILNQGGRKNGQASLLLRDPLSDRLNLKISTREELNSDYYGVPPYEYFSNREENSNEATKTCFYQLHDRLAIGKEKNSDQAREARGLTGWVAVTGFPLKINIEKSKNSLEDLKEQSIEVMEKCNIFGTPVWGKRVSEFSSKKGEGWNKRLLAVPIKSVANPSITIGVLRYSCLVKEPELNDQDIEILKLLATVVAAVINIECINVLSNRNIELELQTKFFNESGNIAEFLGFIGRALRSEIVSLYICLDKGRNKKLRLFDACGISDYVGKLRRKKQVHDYDENTQGLTWELFESNDDYPKVFRSVVDSSKWKGLNCKIFYSKLFERLGIRDNPFYGEKCWERERQDSFSIKLIGIPLRKKGDTLGVLKVEFPKSFDSDQHYTKDDQEFLIEAAKPIKEELAKYHSFVNGSWFINRDSDEESKAEFTRLYLEVLRTNLIMDDEAEEFWSSAKEYAEKIKEDFSKQAKKHIKSLPQNDQKRWRRFLTDISKYAKYETIKETIKWILTQTN